jgi:cell division protein FtsI/penicillin-binding protein 2
MNRPANRFLLVCVIATLLFTTIGAQMVRIQNLPGAQRILDMAENYQGINQMIYPERGMILDAKGRLLAGNETVYEVGLDLPSIRQPETVATVVSTVLGLDYNEVMASIRNEEGRFKYVVLNNYVDKSKVVQFEALIEEYENRELLPDETRPDLTGLIITPYNKRSYPEGSLASNVLGFYSFKDRTNGLGYFGVEETYNDLLAGTPQQVYLSYDPQKIQNMAEIPPGATLVLTIDREIQDMTEKILDQAVETYAAKSGTIIISNPEDGSIMAMATTPRLDPNQYWTYADIFPGTTPFNRAVSQSYETGSVFKVLTLAAALDSGAIEYDSVFNDTGEVTVGGITVNNWNDGAWGEQTMTGCMQHSLNVCLTWMALQLRPERFYRYMSAFGMDRNTGIDLGGEAHWPMKIPGDKVWTESDLATNSFGQGISSTPIQMVAAVGALANEGKMMAPHVVKAMVIDGKQYDIKPMVISQPISAETAADVTRMLNVSLEEESSTALVDGYSVSGKTGTAEIPVPGGYLWGIYNLSFVGWGPVDDPKYLVYLWLEAPEKGLWASEVMAPIFSEVVEQLVVMMNLPPDIPVKEDEWAGAW